MKRLILLLNIIFTSFGTIIAKDYEPTTEKFDKIEMNIEACMKVIRTDSCFSVIIPDTTNLRYLDLIVVNNILKVSYKNKRYKELLEDEKPKLSIKSVIKKYCPKFSFVFFCNCYCKTAGNVVY